MPHKDMDRRREYWREKAKRQYDTESPEARQIRNQRQRVRHSTSEYRAYQRAYNNSHRIYLAGDRVYITQLPADLRLLALSIQEARHLIKGQRRTK